MEQRELFNIAGREEFEYIMRVFGACTDDYLFFFDLDENYYSISERAAERFDLPSNHFYNAGEAIRKIVHPEDFEGLKRDIQELREGKKTQHNLEYRWVDRQGKTVWISCRGVIATEGSRVLIGRVTEIGSKRKADNITGLYAERRLQYDYQNIQSEGIYKRGTLLRIGIDNFKEVNERYGMDVGDDILRLIARCLEKVSGANRCYRLSGDEFAVLMMEDDVQKARKMYHKVRIMIEQDRRAEGYQNFYTISAGVVGFSYRELEFEQLCNFSEFSLGEAKKNGKNCSYVFSQEDYDSYMKSIDIQEKLRHAVNHGFEGFEVYYQPIVSAKTERIVGAEALLRFSCEEYGMLSPGVFIPILEESGLIIPVGEWVYQTAIQQSLQWQKLIPEFRININLSFIQIRKSDVVSGIMSSIEKAGIDPCTVLFEFTESGLISYDDSVQELLDVLNENQVKIALDDFGTGYSSLAYLQNLRVNLLKLDRSFTSKAVRNDFDYSLVGYIVEMAHSIGMTVCFEGIETREELEKLLKLHPDYIQGFYYGRPVNKENFYEQNLTKYNKVS